MRTVQPLEGKFLILSSQVAFLHRSFFPALILKSMYRYVLSIILRTYRYIDFKINAEKLSQLGDDMGRDMSQLGDDRKIESA